MGETYYVGGGLFLLVFIAIGAFIFANLVVAVVVTNLVSGKLSHFPLLFSKSALITQKAIKSLDYINRFSSYYSVP